MPGLYDCIFRSMSRTEYYIHVDIDELMVPLRHSSIPAMVQDVERDGDGTVGSLVVGSRYHCSEYPLNTQYSDLEHLPLQTRLFPYHNVDMHQGGLHKAYCSLQGQPARARMKSGRSATFAFGTQRSSKRCEFRHKVPPKTERESWYAVTDNIHVFSAFLVNTTEYAIHITSLVRSHEPKWLKLHRPPEKPEEKCCAVCIRPSFGSSISLWKIVEFIVHYKLVGVSRFYFYDLQMSSDVKRLLAWLQATGVDVTLVPFKLIADAADVHAQGQMPALYDCIFRSMSATEYYIHVDIDELMVPLRHSSIPAMVQEVEREGNGTVGSLVVRSRYHCSEYPLNAQYSDLEHLPLQTRLFTYHNVDMHQADFTKHIALSRSVCEAGVHTVEQHCTGYNKVLIDSSVAFLNHYRRCCEFNPTSAVNKWNISLWNISKLAVHYSYVGLSASIENDPVVRALRSLIL
ncbi:hypothetical protein MTO96_004024 [Rhipicephalus appendiculatus]